MTNQFRCPEFKSICEALVRSGRIVCDEGRLRSFEGCDMYRALQTYLEKKQEGMVCGNCRAPIVVGENRSYTPR